MRHRDRFWWHDCRIWWDEAQTCPYQPLDDEEPLEPPDDDQPKKQDPTPLNEPRIPVEIPSDFAPVLPSPNQTARQKERDDAGHFTPPEVPIPFPPPNIPVRPLPTPAPVPLRPAAIAMQSPTFSREPFRSFVARQVNSPAGQAVAKATLAARSRSSSEVEEERRFLHNTVLAAGGATTVAAQLAFSSGPPGGPPQGPTAELLSSVRVAETLQAQAVARRRRGRSKQPVRAEGEGTLIPHGIPRPSRRPVGGTSPGGEDENERLRKQADSGRKVAVAAAAAAGAGAGLRAVAGRGGVPAGGGFHRPADTFRPGGRRAFAF